MMKNPDIVILTYIAREMVAGSNDREEASAQKSPLSIAASILFNMFSYLHPKKASVKFGEKKSPKSYGMRFSHPPVRKMSAEP